MEDIRSIKTSWIIHVGFFNKLYIEQCIGSSLQPFDKVFFTAGACK